MESYQTCQTEKNKLELKCKKFEHFSRELEIKFDDLSKTVKKEIEEKEAMKID